MSSASPSLDGRGLDTDSRDGPCPGGTHHLKGSFAMQVLGATATGWGEEGRMLQHSEDRKSGENFRFRNMGLSLSFKGGLGL